MRVHRGRAVSRPLWLLLVETILTVAGVVLPSIGLALAFRAAVGAYRGILREAAVRRMLAKRYRRKREALMSVGEYDFDADAAAHGRELLGRGYRVYTLGDLDQVFTTVAYERGRDSLRDLLRQVWWVAAGLASGLAASLIGIWT